MSQGTDADRVHAAAVEAVEIAVCAYIEDRDGVTLAYVLNSAHRYLGIDELRAASGLDEAFITRLLEEAA